MIDRDIHLARALIVESNALLRSVGTAQLRDLGVGHVTGVARVTEARLVLERGSFDIVVCNLEFEGSDYSGQDLLDELRRERLLPHGTVFLMVTAHASHNQVVEAAEAALDGILVRPYTAATLGARLMEARNRKRELGDVLRALDAGDSEAALVKAVQRFQERQPYWVYCGRLAAELLLGMNRPADAARVFERIARERPTAVGARLGVARALWAQGDASAARQAVSQVLATDPDAADAHDLMGRIQVDLNDFEGAMGSYRQAAELSSGCLLRVQHAGALAFYQGHVAEAQKWLEHSMNLGVQSKLFDALSLLLLAILRHDRGDVAGVVAICTQLRRYCERHPESARLGRLEQAAGVLRDLRQERVPQALSTLQQMAAKSAASDFDLESANILLALWSRLPETVGIEAERRVVVERVGRRFCINKAIGEVLAGAARPSPPAQDVIRQCQAWVSSITQQAMDLALKGRAADAARLLLDNGEQTLNAKLLEMAAALAQRHAAAIPDAQALASRATQLLADHCRAASHIAGIQRSGRSPGGLQLRGRNASQVDHAPA